MEFHAIPCIEPHDSMHRIAWKHLSQYMESYVALCETFRNCTQIT